MKNVIKLVSFILFLMIFQALVAQENKDFEMSIKKTNTGQLKLVLLNRGEQSIQLYPFQSAQNYLLITNPNGGVFAVNPTLCMHSDEINKQEVKQGMSHAIFYDPYEKIFASPRYVSRTEWFGKDKGKYIFIWVVNGKKSNPYYYEKLDDE